MTYLDRKYLELEEKTAPVANEYFKYRDWIKCELNWHRNNLSDGDIWWIGYLCRQFEEQKDKLKELAKEQAMLDEMRREMAV